MKKILLTSTLLILLINLSFSQDQTINHIPLIGDTVPSFTAESTEGRINFPSDYFGKWKILFSHPADFTAVCSSEIITLASMAVDFDNLNTQLLVISTDGLSSHIEWVKSLEGINMKGISSGKIKFPLISDPNLDISRKFGMTHPHSSITRDIRGVFIIDPDNKVRALFYYPSSTGRNLDEIKRTLIAMQTADKYQVLTPANWKPGDDVLIPSPKTIQDSDKLTKKQDENLYSVSWYMWFKKLNWAGK